MHHRNGGHQHLYQSACVFVGFLEATGVVRGLRQTPKIPTPAERLWGEFTDWMRTQRGTMSSTLANYRLPVTALRMFLRFLIARGDCPTGLDYAIPTVARCRLAALPKYLPANDVERLIYS